MSWFRGPYPEFVERCRENFGKGSIAKHLLWPARVQLHGERAITETNTAILVRQTIDGVPVDLTSYARFVDRMEKRDGHWRMVERACIYEQDRLDPVEPSPKFDALMLTADAGRWPAWRPWRRTRRGRWSRRPR